MLRGLRGALRNFQGDASGGGTGSPRAMLRGYPQGVSQSRKRFTSRRLRRSLVLHGVRFAEP